MGEKLLGGEEKKSIVIPSVHHPHFFSSFLQEEKIRNELNFLLLVGLVAVDEVDDVFSQDVEVVTGQVLGLPEAAEGAFTDS